MLPPVSRLDEILREETEERVNELVEKFTNESAQRSVVDAHRRGERKCRVTRDDGVIAPLDIIDMFKKRLSEVVAPLGYRVSLFGSCPLTVTFEWDAPRPVESPVTITRETNPRPTPTIENTVQDVVRKILAAPTMPSDDNLASLITLLSRF